MLIPIDDSVDVKLQNPKSTAKKLSIAISQLQDKNSRRLLFEKTIKEAYKKTNTEEDAQEYISQRMHLQKKCYITMLSNNYTYLTADVCDMVAETQGTLKKWTIQDLLIKPDTTGIVFFEKPKFTKETTISIDTEYNTVTRQANIVGICWIYFTNQPLEDDRHGDVLWLSLISEAYKKHTPTELTYVFGDGDIVYRVSKDGTVNPLTEKGKNAHNKSVMDYFAATMMLMQQREIIAEPETYEPTVKRGKRHDPMLVPIGKNGEKIPFRISTVSLSETARKAYAANNAGTGNKPTKSWWVKGHWRRQPYGPQSSLRKLIYIHPHISGNINAPLDERKTITKIVP